MIHLLFYIFLLCASSVISAEQVVQPASDTRSCISCFCARCIVQPDDLWKTFFTSIDLNQDQWISREEYIVHEQEIFNFRDTDQNGLLDRKEFIYKSKAKRSEQTKPYIRRNVLEKLSSLHIKRANKHKVFSPADSNANGSVSYSEYQQYAYDTFLRLDENADRLLSLDEFRHAFYHIDFE